MVQIMGKIINFKGHCQFSVFNIYWYHLKKRRKKTQKPRKFLNLNFDFMFMYNVIFFPFYFIFIFGQDFQEYPNCNNFSCIRVSGYLSHYLVV